VALTAAVLGFFVITLDASIVNVALPSMSRELGTGLTGLQWVVDGYVLIFAALLLSAGSLSDRIGARSAYSAGLAVFVAASAACGVAPGLAPLVAARLVQGAGAAMMMPSSLTLIREAYPDPVGRGRALALWSVGGAAAAAAGPVAGGALTLVSWRLIFFINLPAGLLTLAALGWVARSPRRPVPFDLTGQIAAVAAMGGLTYGAIEGGADGFAEPRVLAAFGLALLASLVFLFAQVRGRHPMVPLDLLHSRTVLIASWTGFAFIGGFAGLVFVYSLYLQDQRGLSSLATGLTFLPMTILSGCIGMLGARLAERFGPRVPIIGGMTSMGVALALLATLPANVPVWIAAAAMIPVGVCGPLAIPSTTAVLFEAIPPDRSGIASGVFNTSRQVGAALAVAVFGALLAHRLHFERGLRESLLIAAGLAVSAAAANLFMPLPEGETRCTPERSARACEFPA
jgi:DHA2 family methylenomycin A resistance protein-like MFS transporter